MTDWFKNIFHFKVKQEKDQPNTDHPFQQNNQQQTCIFATKETEKDQKNSDDNQDSDQDSLGYTQNQWDEQTINFELQDRMLDCLEQQKHVTSYRQSLILTSTLTKKNSKRFTKKINQQPNQSSQIQQISIQQIIQQRYPQAQQLTNQETVSTKEQPKKKPSQKAKKNRFSKYMKKNQNTQASQQSWFAHFSPELQTKIDTVLKQKQKEIHAQTNESCQDYISRVLNLNLVSNQTNQKVPKQVGISLEVGEISIVKKQSNVSDPSFIVVQQHTQPLIDIIQSSSIENQTHPILTNYKNDQLELKEIQNSQFQQKITLPQPQTNQNTQRLEQLTKQNKEIPPKQQRQIQINNEKSYHVLTPFRYPIFNQISNQPPLLIQTSNQSTQLNHQLPSINSQLIPIDNQQQIQTSMKNISVKKQSKSPLKSPMKFQSSNSLIPIKIQFMSPQTVQQKHQTQQQTQKSPRTKVLFKYQMPQSTSINSKSQQTNKIVFSSPLSHPQNNDLNSIVRIHYIEPQPQERIPIFLRRLRRLNSCYPNLYASKLNIEKINSNLYTILKAMQSAISVIELLFKKLSIQKDKLKDPFIKIQQVKNLSPHEIDSKKLLEDEILDAFKNSKWESYKIEQIDYIKPKQRFQKRQLDPIKFQQAIKTYNEFINFYLKQPNFTLKSAEQTKRYIRVREKISTIVQYLRLISEDLYTFWLMECNYPELYFDFLAFLRLNKEDISYSVRCDEIYAKLLLAEDFQDPISLSVVGKTILEKILDANT